MTRLQAVPVGPTLMVRASSNGEATQVIVVVGILTVLVLAWLLFRAEARRHQE
jgi:hypothetical protein